MTENGSKSTTSSAGADWRSTIARYAGPQPSRAVRQVVGTLVLLFLSMTLMYKAFDVSVWLALALARPTGGRLVRTFVIMHDCAHSSFLPGRRWNDLVGWVSGVLTMTPFTQWRHEHALHHASSGDLDRRGTGDIATLTVREYLALSRWGRFRYRLYRNPMILFGVLGPLYIIVGQRLVPTHVPPAHRKKLSVWGTNAGILALAAGAWIAFGPRALFLVYLPAFYIATAVGVALFYVQHQFEDAYWEGHEGWDFQTAAIEGSSYLKLPKILQWFTGSIGLHHVHHLGPRIPNYRLQRCHDENALFHKAPVVTLSKSIGTMRLALWDEERRRLVRFSDVRDGAAGAAPGEASGEAPTARGRRAAGVDRAAA